MGELKVIDNNRNEADETAVQYIVVKVGNEQYGIDIQYICLLYTSDAADD